MTLREQVGRLIIVGVESTSLSALERAWLRLIRPSGIILFRRNIEEAVQVTSLLRAATETAGHTLFCCVDLEGGLVDRLRDLIAPMPSAAAVSISGKPTLFKKHGLLIAREARALGFNTVFAPVFDLALPISAPILRTRVVSSDSSDVVAYASAFLDGLAQEGILGCGKHFPGLGGGSLDSHHAMPVIDRTWKEMWMHDLMPYRSLSAKLPLVMVSHAAYPRIKDRTPASISSFWISTVLKKHIGYRGLVISDDMEMGGILTQASIEEAAVKAILAGTDLIEICHNPLLIVRAYEAVLSEAEHSAAFRRRVERSSRRVLAHQKHLLKTQLPRIASPVHIQKLRDAVLRYSEEIQ